MEDTTSGHANRREFPFVATAGVAATGLGLAATGLGLAAWPFLAHLGPDASIPLPIEFDFSRLGEGKQVYVRLGDELLMARRRTLSEIDATRAVEVNSLRDPLARNANLPVDAPATGENRTVTGFPEFTIFSALCTKLECVLTRPPMDLTKPGLWQCPCCGSHYDSVGRIVQGPAPRNLGIPVFSNPIGLRIRFTNQVAAPL